MKKFILLIAVLLFANVNVNVNVNKTDISEGDEVIFTITAEGKNVKMPDIAQIGPYKVQGSAKSENVTIINGKMNTQISRSYIFYPLKNITIPSFKVIVDGKTFYTKPIKITVHKLEKTNDKNYDLTLSLDKNESFLGEGRILTIKFSQNIDANPQSIQIQRPTLQDFLINQISSKTFIKNNYKITEYKFLIIPQKSGIFEIGPILANIGILQKENPFDDPFFSAAFIRYKRIVSNEVKLKVKPIPQNSIWGDFNITLSADKKEALANTPVHITLKISGCGDFYDMKNFKLNIKNATIYEKKPVLKTKIINNRLCGVYQKEFTVLSPKDINLSPVSLLEFNRKFKEVKSNPLYIKIENSMINLPKTENFTHPVKIKTKIVYKTNYILILIAFVLGVLITLLLSLSLYKIKFPKKDIYEQIKKADNKELFQLLLPFAGNKKIDEILKKLEANIYKGEKNKIDKKEIIEIIKSL
ncbi:MULTISPECIES: BatD family protein [unclassified Lebetimonas]|uniref:BatD family protein n=1 Tax=unclassified Lebetimonas TaxID=2648158 RepID=UPI000465F52B|nr:MULTISPECIES: BatD family protein [unclassified Lebetimonas]